MPFIMNRKVSVVSLPRHDGQGPFLEHYDVRDAARHQLMHEEPEGQHPAARVFRSDMEAFGNQDFLYVADLPPDRALPLLDETIGSTPSCSPNSSWKSAKNWPRRKGIAAGDKVKVRSNRAIKAVAVVTKRIKPLRVDVANGATPSGFRSTPVQGRDEAGIHHQP